MSWIYGEERNGKLQRSLGHCTGSFDANEVNDTARTAKMDAVSNAIEKLKVRGEMPLPADISLWMPSDEHLDRQR